MEASRRVEHKQIATRSIIVALIIAVFALAGCGSSSDSSSSASVDAIGASPPRGPSGADGTYNCADFDTQDQAQAYFNAVGDMDGLDGDGNGVVCESLPSGSAQPAAPLPETEVADPITEVTPTAAPTDAASLGEELAFQSPTGNLKCTVLDMSAVGISLVTCFASNLGVSLVFSPNATALVASVQGIPPAFQGSLPTLGYGESITLSRVICESSDLGIQCYSIENMQDGFRVSRDGVVLFPATDLDAMSDADAFAGSFEFS